jgi:hypothetical protein
MMPPFQGLVASVIFFIAPSACANNIGQFYKFALPHPICGLNQNYPNDIWHPPANHPHLARHRSPFSACFTFAQAGFFRNESEMILTDGLQALGQLWGALLSQSDFEERILPKIQFNSVELNLNCRFPYQPDFSPEKPTPICSKHAINVAYAKYEALPEVIEFRAFEAAIKKLDLQDAQVLNRLRQARAVVTAAAGQVKLGEVTVLLE